MNRKARISLIVHREQRFSDGTRRPYRENAAVFDHRFAREGRELRRQLTLFR